MISGFILSLRGFFHEEFFDRWLFRTLHLLGIVYVAVLSALGKYCPLTVWEYSLRQGHSRGIDYPGSFIIYHLERIVYPGVNPVFVRVPTIIIGLTTIFVFIIRPPKKIKILFNRGIGE